MGSNHGHGHAHYNRAFAIGVGLNVAFVIVEFVFGTLVHSLALLADAGHNLSDVVSVLDTESSLGPYAEHPKALTLGDLVRMHGHACDGLVMAAAALSVGLDELYPDGVVDRTDTGCITNNSPCFGDVAAYVTGGRIRFGSQKIDPARGMSFVVYRFSTAEAVEVELRKGVFPERLIALETKLRGGSFTEEEMRKCQVAQWDYAKGLLQHPLGESFLTRRLPDLTWTPDPYSRTGSRGDIINRTPRTVQPDSMRLR